MERKRKILKFRAVDRDIFKMIINGGKKIETRAATERYRDIKAGDIIILVCGDKRVNKKVKKVGLFESIVAVLKKYKPEAINPNIHTAQEAKAMWYSFPGYKEKIKKYGLIAIELE